VDGKVVEYLIYTPASLLLTVWVATTLLRHGRPFLLDVFHGEEALADSINHLLVVGFSLVNLGYVTLQLRLDTAPQTVAQVIEALAGTVGLVLVVLGIMQFGNLLVFTQMRQRAQRPGPAAAPPPPGWQPQPPR
jgi:hypothetical protein